MASDPVRSDTIQFGNDFDLDPRTYELRSGGRIVKLERIPMELLILLIEERGQLVTRSQIIERIWGKDVFLDTDNSINAAIRKIRQVLKDDPEQPRFVQTITGRGYRFIAPVVEAGAKASARDTVAGLKVVRSGFSEKAIEPVVEAPPSGLPVQRTGFVGREKEVAAAEQLLLRPDVSLVTITGPGGIGKTRLAVQLASRLAEHFPGGTYFVSLSSLSDPGLIAPVIVQALGIREAGAQSPLEILKANLRSSGRTPKLLLLDNFEHLVEAVPTVVELLSVASKLKILVTSRSALHVYGENEFPVPPLALPEQSTSTVDVLSRSPAVALFVQRAVAAKPDFQLTPENAAAVAEICARLDGLPLAIELAAARVKVLSPSAMRTRLSSRLQLLTGGARDLPQRHQTLRGAMDWSYDLLTPTEQRLFRRLSVFVGGCTLEGAEAVCDAKGDLELDLLDGMESMVDKSLAQRDEQRDGEPRFVMLETIREYALEKLETSGEKALTKRAHAAYCLVLAEEKATELSGTASADWLAHYANEYDNFRAALEWLTETEDAEWGLRLGSALFRYWEMREYLAEGRARLDKLLKIAGAQAPTKARSRALFAAGVLGVEQGDYGAADALIRESLEITRQLGDAQGAAVSLNALAVNARDRGDIQGARLLFEESLTVWREVGDPKAVASAVSNLANIVKLQGDNTRAQIPVRGVSLDLQWARRSNRGCLVDELPRRCGPRSRGRRSGASFVRTRPGDFPRTWRPLGHCRHAR